MSPWTVLKGLNLFDPLPQCFLHLLTLYKSTKQKKYNRITLSHIVNWLYENNLKFSSLFFQVKFKKVKVSLNRKMTSLKKVEKFKVERHSHK